MSNALSQIAVVTALNLRTIGERRGASLATVFGVAGVVAVFVGVLSIGEGFRATMSSGGREDVAMIMRSGNDSEMMSGLGREDTDIVKQAPGVARDAQGPIASAELFVVINVPKRSTGTDANVPLRGVQAKALEVRGTLKIVEGRMFEPGRNEVIVGRAAQREFRGLDLGTTNRWGQNDWTVVGIFEDGGSVVESEIWSDAAVLQPAYNRGNFFQSVRAKLTSKSEFQTFKDAITTDPRLDVQVDTERDYFAGQSKGLTAIITGLGTIIAVLMGFGAVFGALNTMYSAVSARTREIATLRAIGFRSAPVVVSVLAESLVLSLVGGILGAIAAYFGFDGFQAATLNWQSFSQVAFKFAVTPKLLLIGISYAMVMGLIGGLFPAIRAARLPVTAALREA
ncbi:MAG: ABC transporter permease [Thermoanaerobaculia bacterium]|jgi:putative ABC transport system permease protein|nr:ABC transporter permease [Thermoanaerobaculia bacterium]MBP9823771.1 ABC transporter permease [Thermoanaerobaculia bacterium]